METLDPLAANWLAFILGFLGIIVHYFKKKIRGQTFSSVIKYFSSHFTNTFVTVAAYIGVFFGLAATGPVSIPAAILAGYGADSFFNKSENDK